MAAKTVADKLLIKARTAFWISDDQHRARQLLDKHCDRLAASAIVWVAYPKGNRSDINRDSLWPIVGEYGLRPNGQVAVDEVWSALRFRPLMEGEAPFTGGAG
jgi:hypothetical protein